MDATPTRVISSVWAGSNEPHKVTEVQKAVNCLQLKRSTGPDVLSPALFKNTSYNFITLLPCLVECIWRSESVPLHCGESRLVLFSER